MSRYTVANFYFRENPPPMDEVFCTLAREFSKVPSASTFDGIDIFYGHDSTRYFDKDCTVDELCRAAKGKTEPNSELMTTSAFDCNNTDLDSQEEDYVLTWLQSWGTEQGSGVATTAWKDRPLSPCLAASLPPCWRPVPIPEKRSTTAASKKTWKHSRTWYSIRSSRSNPRP